MYSIPTPTALALGGIAIAVSLSGCAASTDAASGGTSVEGPYADGEYSATGEYQSPGGPESIEVDLTLEGDVVTDVAVVGNATAGNAVRYQGMFAEGIAGEVVGKSIDELQVDKVAGSSLTSDGFNDALEQIKAEAVA